MLNSLLKNGYRPGSGVPVTLIGYSGGGQISLGASAVPEACFGRADYDDFTWRGDGFRPRP